MVSLLVVWRRGVLFAGLIALRSRLCVQCWPRTARHSVSVKCQWLGQCVPQARVSRAASCVPPRTPRDFARSLPPSRACRRTARATVQAPSCANCARSHSVRHEQAEVPLRAQLPRVCRPATRGQGLDVVTTCCAYMRIWDVRIWATRPVRARFGARPASPPCRVGPPCSVREASTTRRGAPPRAWLRSLYSAPRPAPRRRQQRAV